MSVLVRAIKSVWAEVNKPQSYVSGDEFEGFVREKLFPANAYDMIQRTHDYSVNKEDFVESSKEPDFKFRARKSGREFFIEAKYRSHFYDGAIEWCKHYQLNRYREIDSKIPVYIVLGVEGQPGAPGKVFLFPVKDAKYTKLFRSFLTKYEISTEHCVNERAFS